MTRSALVTGATGFIGSHLTRTLVREGWTVRALVRNLAAAKELASLGVNLVQGDLAEPASLKNIGDGIDAVFHTAAQLNLNIPSATANDFRTNLTGTQNLLDAIRTTKLRAFVHVSSLAAIGIRPVGMIDETFPCDPDLEYGKSKLESDLFLLREAKERGLPLVVLRPPTVYGPGERYNFLSLCVAIRSGKFVLIGDGSNRIDFCGVENLIQAMILAGEKGGQGDIYLIADDPPLPFRETVDVLWRIVRGSPAPRFHLPVPLAYAAAYPLELLGKTLKRAVPLYPTRVRTMSGDMCFDTGKAKRELGYRPKGPFAEMVRPAIDWYWSQGLLRRPG